MGLFSVPNYGANGYQANLQGIAANEGQIGQTAQQGYTLYQPAYQQAVNTYGQYLATDPATQAYNTAQINNATQGAAGDADMQRAALDASLAQRGFPGASSMAAGGASSISAALQGQIAAARNQQAQQNILLHRQNLGDAANLYGGVTAGYYGQGMGAYGQQAGINQDLYQTALQRQAAQRQQLTAGLTALGTLAGGAFRGPSGAKIGSTAGGVAGGGGGGYGTDWVQGTGTGWGQGGWGQ